MATSVQTESGGGVSAVTRVLFFFSSRRRHTRLQGDWSSDVCSSDLAVLSPLPGPRNSLSLWDIIFINNRGVQMPAPRAGEGFWAFWMALFLALVARSEEHTSELQSPCNLVCRLLLEKKNKSHGEGPSLALEHRPLRSVQPSRNKLNPLTTTRFYRPLPGRFESILDDTQTLREQICTL